MAALSYERAYVLSDKAQRAAWYMGLTALVFGVMALLVGWALFDQFVLFWKEHVLIGAYGPRSKWFTVEFRWLELWKVLPPVAALLSFALLYFLLGRATARGNRTALVAATLMAMIHALAAALWALTLIGFGFLQAVRALSWWERLFSSASLLAAVLLVPWMIHVTLKLAEALRTRRRPRESRP